ncbi:helix-turn-helix transcriptional regulator [Fodinicurvata sp. EGI_FJ10296]|uniref:helix-turn-helix transcriptional regulator n=1 Tax=Fodinicurvata sp. EGI_FJ10296 TaxID=3231908 RepID=UPI0034519603
MDIGSDLLRRLTALQRGFLSVQLDSATIRDMLAEIGKLVGADAAFAGWLDDGRPWMVPWRAGPQIEAYMAHTFAGVDRDGNIRCHDRDLDTMNRRRRSFGTGVYHETELAARQEIVKTAYFNDAFEPAGMPQVIGMTARLSVGEAMFAFGFQEPDAPGFVSGETEIVLGLLLPSFESGFQAIDRRNRHRERLDQAIAASLLPARIVSAADEPDDGDFLQLPLPELSPIGGPELRLALRQMDTARMAGILAGKFGLTARQRDVAKLILQGASSAAIAAELGISHNTARRHCEAVLQKTEISRRDQLSALVLDWPLASP